MQIRVGISQNDLKTRLHPSVKISCAGALGIEVLNDTKGYPDIIKESEVPAQTEITVKPAGADLVVTYGGTTQKVPYKLLIFPEKKTDSISLTSLYRASGKGKIAPKYRGVLEISNLSGHLRVVLISDLEDYVFGVLGSEIPESYELEAMKAQAVAARTYGLRPRIDHEPEGYNVCDSWLCCQYFIGTTYSVASKHQEAIRATASQILTWQDEPILALFSACAGGHTENYENCFSEPKTNKFPADPLPYLVGVAEGILPQGYPSEPALRALYRQKPHDTCDGWSSCFSWQVNLSAADLEGHMHHVVQMLSEDPETAPFITKPASGAFGHIQKFEIPWRGVSGEAIQIDIHTSTGVWSVKKELVIRSAFACPEIALVRLKSARMFFDHTYDKLGLLSNLTISGFGWGHGVGMQQHGAQGLAKEGKNYKQILAHYYTGAQIATT